MDPKYQHAAGAKPFKGGKPPADGPVEQYPLGSKYPEDTTGVEPFQATGVKAPKHPERNRAHYFPGSRRPID